MNSPIEIQQSKFKNALFIIGCLAFLYISFWLMFGDKQPQLFDLFWGASVVIFVIGLLGSLLSGLLLYFFLTLFLSKDPLIVISDKGIKISLGEEVSVRFFPWGEVLTINEKFILNKKLIQIEVKQPQSIYFTKTNMLFGQLKKPIFGMKDPHEFLISANNLACSHKELKTSLENGFEVYKRTTVS